MRPLNMSEKKVLLLLEQDCRLSANQIAKKTRLSAEGVLKIIQRLVDSKLILRFNTKYNYSSIGYELFPVHIKLAKSDVKTLNQIKKSISSHKTCTWFVFCEGEYDLLLSFKISSEKDKEDMNSLIVEMSDHILEKEASIVLQAFEIGKSFSDNKKVKIEKNNSRKIFVTFDNNQHVVSLSEEESQILSILKNNCRTHILEISKKTNLSPQTVSYKIKGMIKNKVISGFKTKINTSVLGYHPCIALISLGKHTSQDMAKFVTYCQYTEGINYLVRQIGKYEIELTLDVSSIHEFYSLMNAIREEFAFVKNITTLITKDYS